MSGLTIKIGNTPIVKDSSFFIRKGKITALIGESGSGKSMTVAAILRLLPPAARVEGTILFEGKNLLEASHTEIVELRRRRVFTIFQDASSSFNLAIRMARQLYAFSAGRINDNNIQFKKKMGRIMNDLRLPHDVLNQYPHELSGGMLQRCMIACALYVEPDLLIADEPTSALDMEVREDFLKELRVLNEKHGTTVLLITHDLDIVANAANDMVVMHKGKVVETGIVSEVLERPEDSYTKRLLNSRF